MAQKGEVSSVLVDQDRIIAISNHSDGKSYIHEFDVSGGFKRSIELRGGATTGTLLKDRGVAISYRVGQDLFVERLTPLLLSAWVAKLHEIRGGNTKKSRIHPLPDGIAVVAGNTMRLNVYRLTETGALKKHSVDTLTGYGLPTTNVYSSSVDGRNIHIRGEAWRNGSSTEVPAEIFHFVAQE